jgi:hypothetical protein
MGFFFLSPNENHLSNELADRLYSLSLSLSLTPTLSLLKKIFPNRIIIFIRHVLSFVYAVHNKVWTCCACVYRKLASIYIIVTETTRRMSLLLNFCCKLNDRIKRIRREVIQCYCFLSLFCCFFVCSSHLSNI